MIHTMSRWQSRLLALLILFLIIATLVAVTVVPAFTANQHYQGVITGMEDRLEILRRTADIGSTLKSEYTQLSRWQASNVHYLVSRSDALAAAELQRIVKRTVSPKGGEIISTQILPSKQEEGSVRVTLKVRMKGSLDTLVSVFYALETGNPFLFLDNVSLRGRAINPRRYSKTTARKISGHQMLDVDFELSGYMRGAES